MVFGLANNSLEDCQAIAKKFKVTVFNGPVDNITATSGTNVSCFGLNSTMCPGQYGSDGKCIFQHKLCVTCIQNGTTNVQIRIQSNGLPPFCPNLDGMYPFHEQNIDFAVNFNPDVSIKSPLNNPLTQSELNAVVCNYNNTYSTPINSHFKLYSSSVTVDSVAGISIDGVAIYNGDNYFNEDTFYPPTSNLTEWNDLCLGHTDPKGTYHYHIGSSCSLNPPIGLTTGCLNLPACHASIGNYSTSMFSISYRNLTVIGIGKDGHIIYGPYTLDGVQVINGFDVCNGMFHDSVSNYGYFATNTFPYLIGCFGPSTYPATLLPNCTKNPPAHYKMSYYATILSMNNNSAVSFRALNTISLLILLATTILLKESDY